MAGLESDRKTETCLDAVGAFTDENAQTRVPEPGPRHYGGLLWFARCASRPVLHHAIVGGPPGQYFGI
ncbi:MAG: hypothetical protein K0U79_04010 [Gammaproteobacteria bacterium]|nr:hypothetical protein [Gammaproteobacteria bacterium]